VAYVPDNPRTKYKANAHLIAAAPEMLEALEAIDCVFVSTNEKGDEARKLLRAAIRKAKGEE
jgi:hypothetical protein